MSTSPTIKVDVSRPTMSIEQFRRLLDPLSMELGLRLCAERYSPAEAGLQMPKDLPAVYSKMHAPAYEKAREANPEQFSTQLQELAEKVWRESPHLHPASSSVTPP